MLVADNFKKYVYRTLGIIVYFAAKALARIANCNKKHLHLFPDMVRRISFFFPSLDLSRVRIVKNAGLPANMLKRSKGTAGMTFGRTIYLRDGDSLDYEEIRLLLHELNHVEQMQRLGEFKFASRYGEQYKQYGYYNMPLEKEAYDFVSDIPFSPSYYLKNNEDVRIAARGTDAGAFIHWLDHGIDEKRDSTDYFNPSKYLNNYDDLVNTLGKTNDKAAILHWIRVGKQEGRKGK